VTPYVNGGSYGIAKHALLGFNKTLREELKPHGIRVVALLPGATLTASWAGTDLPDERFMPPEDIAELAWTAWARSDRSVVEELRVRPMLGDLPCAAPCRRATPCCWRCPSRR
jgi:NAD(P)-dependent dehydrogenase (short-subunit alcohol dehydrogenase family)